MRICVIGTGYVGLVVGTCLAEGGNDVVCVDTDQKKVEMLSAGNPTIHEYGLPYYLSRNIAEERLSFTTDLSGAVEKSQVVFIAVGTPALPDGHIDTSSVWKVAEGIGKSLAHYTVIATKSTVPVGTAAKVREIVSALTEQEFSVVSNPEFLKEGTAVEDFLRPERVVVGLEPGDDRARDIMRELYAPFLRTGKPLIEMSNASAELCKYACNSFLATKVSFMNQMANLSEAVGADVNEVRIGMGADPRIGPKFLFPGVGYGGSCFPKDVSGIIMTAREAGAEIGIVEAVQEVNETQKKLLVERVKGYFGGDLQGKKGAIWGLSFKPRTDDMREAPSIQVVEGLCEAGAKLSVFDPAAMDNARELLGEKVRYVRTNYEALAEADFLVVITEWNEFRRPDFERVKKLMRQPVIFDGRNIYSRKRLENMGFTYFGIGC
jgi:UDPglucose 6-dehydrogenase